MINSEDARGLTMNTNATTKHNPLGNSNVKVYTDLALKTAKDKDAKKGKASSNNTNSKLGEIKGLIKSFDYVIEKYAEFQKDMQEIDETKKRAERELQIYYQYKGSKNLTNQDDGIVADYKFIFAKEKRLREKL